MKLLESLKSLKSDKKKCCCCDSIKKRCDTIDYGIVTILNLIQDIESLKCKVKDIDSLKYKKDSKDSKDSKKKVVKAKRKVAVKGRVQGS